MARYYTESKDGLIYRVVAQDETGIYSGWASRNPASPDGWEVRTLNVYEVEGMPLVKLHLPGWQEEREVSVASPDWLEYVRRFERNAYSDTTPSEIIETDHATAEEAIRAVLTAAGRDKLYLR